MKSFLKLSFATLTAAAWVSAAGIGYGQTHGVAGAGPANTGNSQSSASPNIPNNAATGQPGAQSVPLPSSTQGSTSTGVSAQQPMINGQPMIPPALQNPPVNAGSQLPSPNTPSNSVTGQPGAQSVPMPAGNGLQNQPNAPGTQGLSPNNSSRLPSPNMPPNSVTGRPGAQSVPMPAGNSLQTQPNNPAPFQGGSSPFSPSTAPTGRPAAQRGTTNQTSANLGGEQDIPPPVTDDARSRADANRDARENLRADRQELRQDRQTARDANEGRFSNYNGEWWYAMPDNSWMYYRDNKWNRYDANTYQPGRYTTGYRGRGDNGVYYDESGRQYRRDYSPLRTAIRNAEANGNGQVDINAPGTHVEAGPGGVQIGTPANNVQVGTPPENNNR